jgi:hypothetical protein
MIWFITLAVLAALLFVMLYKKPVNRVFVPPPAPTPPQPRQDGAPPPMDLGDLFGRRPAAPKPDDQPRA